MPETEIEMFVYLPDYPRESSELKDTSDGINALETLQELEQ
jgi:hypothetical protein